MITNDSITGAHWVIQGTGNIASDMDGEKVMLSLSNGKYYNLGSIGGLIWDYIQSPITIDKLVEILTAEYRVEESICREHVMTFLYQLSKEELISITLKP